MSPASGCSDNLLKSRCVRLVPKRCILISFSRQCASSSAVSPSSSSATSERVPPQQWEHGESAGVPSQDCVAQCGQDLHRHSFSSVSTGTTTDNRDCLCQQSVNCAELFSEFIRENVLNTSLSSPANSLCKLDLAGVIYPTALIVAGPGESLKLLCSLWSRRLLKSPHGYSIRFIGHTSVFEVTTVTQSHFTPLAEALYRCVEELVRMQQEANLPAIVHQLNVDFPCMELPSEEILNSSLSGLVSETKLNFDDQRQVYTIARALLTPWDQFENLTLSDNFKSNKEDDEIELEFRNVNSESPKKCANLEQLFYLKSNTLSTESSSIGDCKEDHFLESTKLLRRNSSLSNEIDKLNSEHRRANFKRSKSFKLSYKPSPEEKTHLTKDCTCNEIIIKRQSLLSKLWKFGNSNGHLKSRSMSSSSSVSSVKHCHFGSQFPESADNSAVIPFDESYARKQVEMQSKSTQTVKCGSEDMVTLIMKQAGRHALARNRASHRHLERTQLDACCAHRLASRNKCTTCETALSPYSAPPRHRNGYRKARYRHLPVGDSAESYKCQCLSNTNAPVELAPSHGAHLQPPRHRETSRYRKLRSSCLRHCKPNEWLVDYENVARAALSKVVDKQSLRRAASKFTYDHYSDEDELSGQAFSNFRHKHLDLFGLNRKTLTIETNESNNPSKINGYWQPDRNRSHCSEMSCVDKQNIFPFGNVLQPRGSFVINNSVNLKIEIETSSLVPSVSTEAGLNGNRAVASSVPVGRDNALATSSGNELAHFQVASSKHLATKMFESKLMENKSQFANDIYSELTFDQQTHQLSQVNSRFGQVALEQSSKTPYSPDLNYTNSITALKEQIARAKANFFNAPLSSSTTTRPLPASSR